MKFASRWPEIAEELPPIHRPGDPVVSIDWDRAGALLQQRSPTNFQLRGSTRAKRKQYTAIRHSTSIHLWPLDDIVAALVVHQVGYFSSILFRVALPAVHERLS
jgi:hypothetical protein